ncbi:MAG: hypothetical protein IPP77_10005 [Bacteroidetes bacterium]|nr:hypothetical protein [Bacteroidota bacterium]
MKSRIHKNLFTAVIALLIFSASALAQSKDIDKGNEALKKAMEQKDAAKRQDGINKAKESFQKGGMKPQEISGLIGDAYLEKGDLVNATNAFNASTKELKKDGLKRVAEGYVEQAFSTDNEKTRPKTIGKAMSLFAKSDATKEGARLVGDRYYEQGEDGYDQALNYYILGETPSKVEQIANDYFKKGGAGESKAAETFTKLKSPEGYQKAGDIYFDRKEYQKAIEAYEAGGNTEGIKKYADYLYEEHRDAEADNYYVKLAGLYAGKDDMAAEKLAAECLSKNRYALAARIYEAAGNMTLSDKNNAFAKLISFDLDSAKIYFTNVNDMAMIKTIDGNIKLLNPLKDLAQNFDDLKLNEPQVNLIVDEVSGKSVPSPSDKKMLEDYYKSVKDQIIKNVFDVSSNIAKLTNPELKKYAKIRFWRIEAVRNILDKDTFVPRKQKADIKAKDIGL